jgi:hypothetical protein
MTANTSPIFALTPNIGFSGNLTSATNNYDGTSGTTLTYTSGTNGSYVRMLTAEAAGTNAATTVRVFINNGATVGTATNNLLFVQMSLPATTASSLSATVHIELPLNIQLPAGYKVYVLLSFAVAAGWNFAIHGGDY